MVQRLLLKFSFLVLTIAFIALLMGCENILNKKNPQAFNDLTNPEQLLKFSKQKICEDVEKVIYDFFEIDSVRKIAAGVEIFTEEEWGIKFAFYKTIKDTVQLVYETKLLDGSMKESEFSAIKLNKDYYYLYYNSGSYFLGSGGGEIMAYLIDLPERQVFYAHLFIIPNKPVSLFLSPNIKDEKLKDYFLKLFKNEYPDLKIVTTDVKFNL